MKKFVLFLFPLILWGCSSTENLETSSVDDASVTTVPSAITQSSVLADFAGKPSLIVFGGTYCPHCRNAMPQLKSQIWDVYSAQANIWVNVIDQKRFDVEGVAQGFNPALDYTQITGEECGYVPSWIILDRELNVVKSQCGGGDATTIKETLATLL